MEDKEKEKASKVIFFRHCSRTSLSKNDCWSVTEMTWFPWLRDKDRLKCEGILMNKDIAFYEPYDSLFTAEGPMLGSVCTESRLVSIKTGMCKI